LVKNLFLLIDIDKIAMLVIIVQLMIINQMKLFN